MNSLGRFGIFFVFAVATLTFIGCTKEKKVPEVHFLEIDDFASYQSPAKTSTPIQNAARAVVRVGDLLAGPMGTGFLISADGLLMTNNHILGRENCAQTGCQIKLDFDLQNDIAFSEKNSIEVFAKPLFSSPAGSWDFTIVQLYKVENNQITEEKLKTDHFLEIERKTPQQLLQKKLFVVGHPLAEMKKVKQVEGYHVREGYIALDDYVFGGNSGSPVIDESGKMVAILHSGMNESATVSRNGIQGISYATASDTVLSVMNVDGERLNSLSAQKKNITENFMNIDAKEFTHEDQANVLDPSQLGLIYYSRRMPSQLANKNVVEKTFSDWLKRCEETFGEPSMIARHSFENDLRDCLMGKIDLMSCSGEPSQKLGLPYCPSGEEYVRWNALMQKVHHYSVNELGSIHFGVWMMNGALAKNSSASKEGQIELLTQLLKTKPVLDFELAGILSDFEFSGYKDPITGLNPVAFLDDFKNNKFHHKELGTIGKYVINKYLKAPDDSTKSQLLDTMKYIMSHRDLTILDRFQLESMAHRHGLLKLL